MAMTQTCWRDSARTVRVGFLDARAASGLFVWMLHLCWPAFWLSLAVMALFLVLEHFGLSAPAAGRAARTLFLPAVRTSHSLYLTRRQCV